VQVEVNALLDTPTAEPEPDDTELHEGARADLARFKAALVGANERAPLVFAEELHKLLAAIFWRHMTAPERQAVQDHVFIFASNHDYLGLPNGEDGVREIWLAAVAKAEQASDEPAKNTGKTPKPTWRDCIINAQDLCEKEFPTVKYVVPNLFPEGVILLVSRPKLGKSWLLQQVGSSVALANAVLVSPAEPDKPAHGDVLYLNLEDGDRRAQRRMTKYFGANRENWPARMTIARAWKRIDQGGLEDLREWCKSLTKPTLIMIDTLKRVRPPKRNNQSDYDADYEACQGLLGLCREFPGLVIIVAHHDRRRLTTCSTRCPARSG
jgi:hypothetical protein